MEFNKELDKINQENNQIKKEEIDNNDTYLALKHQHDLLQKNNDALKDELDSAKRVLDIRDESIEKYIKTINEWKNKYMKLQEENNNFKAIIDELSEKHTKQTKTNKDTSYLANEKVEASNNLTQKLDELTIERDKYKQLYEDVIGQSGSPDQILPLQSTLSDDEQKDDPEINDSLLHFSWDLDKNLLDNFKNMKYFLCKSNEIQVIGYEEYKWIFTLESSDNKVALTVSLTQLPNVVGAIKLNFKITCDQLLYVKQYDGVVLTIKGDDFFDDFFKDLQKKYQTGIVDKFDLNEFDNKQIYSLKFKCSAEILVSYDLFGGVFLKQEKPIMVCSSELNHKLVFGYLDQVHDFDLNKIESSPMSIYELIYKYYLMMIVIVENKGEFVWKFNDQSEIKLFLSCNKDDVITSRKFELMRSVFYFELTPNGWGENPKGECLVWLAVESFSKNAVDVEVLYRLSCDAVGYRQQKIEKLTDPRHGAYSTGPSREYNMKIEKFKDLKQWEFKMYIEVRRMWDDRGTIIFKSDSLVDFEEKPLETPIVIAASDLNHKLVFGYVDEIQDFNFNVIELGLTLIYDLIYKYYLMMIVVEDSKEEFVWKFNNKSDIKLFMNCAKDDIITSRKFILFGNLFYFELTPNGWGSIPQGECVVWLAVESFSKNAVIVEVLYRLTCEAIGYIQQKTEKLIHAIDGTYSISAAVGDKWMKMDKFSELEEWEFKMFVEVRTMWDKRGIVIYKSDKPVQISDNLIVSIETPLETYIMVAASELNHMVVLGYSRDIHDKNQLCSSCVYDLIYKYYLRMIIINECKGEFVWKFDKKSDIKLFMNCAKDDVITSSKFEVFGSVFYFELTPNGWGGIPKGECLVWLAVESFAQKAIDAEISYSLSCDAVGYSQQKIEKLSDRRTALTGNYSIGPSITDNWMKINQFNDLKQWEFKMCIEIRKMWDDKGNIVYQSESK